MKKTLFFLFALFAGTLFYGCSEDETSVFGSIYGIVTNAETGEPVRNAEIILSPGNISTVSGGDGHFEFGDLEPKQYKLQVAATGYMTDSRQITVIAGTSISSDIRLTPTRKTTGIEIAPSAGLHFGTSYDMLTFEIRNISTSGSIDWVLTGDEASWLTVTPRSGTIEQNQKADVTVTVDRSKLAGDETAILTIEAAGGTQTIRISVAAGTSDNPETPDNPGNDNVTNGLYAYYTFENNSLNTVDGANNAMGINSPTYTDGLRGTKAIKFNVANNSYLSIPEGLIDKYQFSVSFWAKNIGDGHYFHSVRSSGNNVCEQNFSLTMTNGLLRFLAKGRNNYYSWSSATGVFTHPAIDNGWHMITLVSDFNKMSYATITTKLYIDGCLCDTVTEECNPFDQDGGSFADYNVGIRFMFGGSYAPRNDIQINGIALALDNLRVYNTRCLTDAEVMRIYNYEK